MLDATLNFAAALAGLIAAWRGHQTTTIHPPTEPPYGVRRPSTRGAAAKEQKRALIPNFSAWFGIRPLSPNANYLNTLERVKGIEPSYSAWKAAALPLSYTR